MSYQVLARKWRPKKFQDVIGQEITLRMLSNALEQQRLHHAYLFTGTRGVGKTTLARILAKCLNCESGVSAQPCMTCSICTAIDEGKFLDLYEIDAASRTKVEDTRELLENVLYPPVQGRYKIYLIDEVHMLSTHSFNALLKTLEEPPTHVKFLLATTDPKKLPITILSRCLQFHLKAMTIDVLMQHLKHICEAENLTYETDALIQLAKAANGSVRDALSLLDQAIAFSHKQITTKEMLNMLGCTAQTDLLPLLDALRAQDGVQLLNALDHINTRAPDFHELLNELISLFHQLAIAKVSPKHTKLDETFLIYQKHFNAEELQLYYQIALLSKRDLPYAATPEQGFTMAMLRILAFKPTLKTDIFVNESMLANNQSLANEIVIPTQVSVTPFQQLSTETQQLKSPEEIKPEISSISYDWRDILPKLGLTGMAYALASNCTLDSINKNDIKLALSRTHQPMLNAKLKERIAEALTRFFNNNIKLDIRITTEELNTPVKQKTISDQLQLEKGKTQVLQDPLVKQLIEMYDATVDISLIDA